MVVPDRFAAVGPLRTGPASLRAPEPPPYYAAPPAPEQPEFVDLFRRLWRHRLLIAGCLLACAIAAIVAVRAMPSYYIAEARVVVGVPALRVLNIESVLADLNPDADQIQNEAYVVQSRAVAGQVVDSQRLMQDPEFNPTLAPPSFWSGLLARADRLISGVREKLPAELRKDDSAAAPAMPASHGGNARDAVVDGLLSRLDVSVLGRSHVLSIKMRAAESDKAAALANAFADRYLAQQKQDKVAANDEAETFLVNRITELRAQADKADRAVEEYRQRYGLYKGASVGVTTQQLTELNTQLISAQTAKAEAESRLGEAQALSKTGIQGDSIPVVLQSPLIQSLKQQEATAAGRLADLSGSYGPQHPRIVRARAEVEDIRRKIRLEISRTVDGLRHEARTAEARYEALRQNFEALKKQTGGVNEKSIELSALEREATVDRNLLEQMMSRAKESIGQDQLQRPNAKLISVASPPARPGYPPKTLIVFLGAVGGLLLGMAIALLKDSVDSSFRRGDQVEAATGLPVLAMVPVLTGRMTPIAHVLRRPISPYSEALRKLNIGLEMSEATHSPKTVLFASAVPEEGKSVLVSSLGRMLASYGRRVLLIDCDWRNPRLHRLFRCGNRTGLADLLTDEDIGVEPHIVSDTLSGVDILPAGQFTAQAMRHLTSDRMRLLLDALAQRYDLILLDSAPVLVGAEILTLSRMVEKVAYVIRWGHTRRDVAMEALKDLVDVHADIAGVVMTRVDPKGYRKYAAGHLIYEYERPMLAKAAEWN